MNSSQAKLSLVHLRAVFFSKVKQRSSWEGRLSSSIKVYIEVYIEVINEPAHVEKLSLL